MIKTLVLFLCAVGALGGTIQKPLPPSNGLIVGGQPTIIEYFPWMVSMVYFGSHRCGSSILTPTKILTAAHCTVGTFHQFLSVRAGSSFQSSGGTVIAVSRVIEHEQYNRPSRFNNDIGLMILANSLQFSQSIQPVALPQQGAAVRVGSWAFVSGWGHLTQGGVMPEQLHYVAVPILDQNLCAQANQPLYIQATMICAGDYYNGGIDACQNDSGGPLVVDNVLEGVVSWGRGCAQPGAPGVYAKVSNFRNWIDSTN